MNNLKKARENAGYSQKEVAITLKVSAPAVSDWESGKKNPNNKNLQALSELYDQTTDYLLGRTDTPQTEKSPPDGELVSDEDIKHALFGGDKDITDEMYDDVKRYAEFVKEKNRKNGEK